VSVEAAEKLNRSRVAVIVADSHARRQAAVEHWLTTHPDGVRAVIAEGALQPLSVPVDVVVAQLMAGCACCQGQLPLRVALVRILRTARPRFLLLLVGSSTHLERLRALLEDGSLGVQLEVES